LRHRFFEPDYSGWIRDSGESSTELIGIVAIINQKEGKVKRILTVAMAVVLAYGMAVGNAAAVDGAPLFINLTSDDAHRAKMGIGFGKNQLERNHPLTIFFNDRGVHVLSTAKADIYGEHHKTLIGLIEAGATILICPMCKKHYGIADGDLLPGVKVGNPDLTGGQLFQEGIVTLSW
jgi:hypothetical protein